ncbi:WD40/YVTN/BNR-like repeat-containing protein [Bryobacter aggregatus]|uniref:WD40/YVTN/BNR-like repeat-containing protein n=1 Tax=Bryobacter aggregatus TaxID=360054 RepID=UPI0004E197A8|nr:hypothetical protein [Bryobacter aggregatus]
MNLFLAIWLLAQTPPELPTVYQNTEGSIRLPNRCAELDLAVLGLTCSESEPCPTYLEISSVESTGQLILIAGNLHTQSSTLQSILLLSDDGGSTWREAHPRLKASTLESMQFSDFSNGWAVGHVSLALPRDPFVLVTSDGGRSWRKVDLYADSRVGVIEDFAFQNAKRGWLLIDNKGSGEGGRYEFYESQTGGTSWELREIASKIPKTTPHSPSNSARVKADEKKGLLRIEVRSGNTWREVSAFKLKLEDCKPPQQ